MRRRRFLAGACACAGAAAGCAAPGAPVAAGDAPARSRSVAGHGFPQRICEERIREDFGIRAIDDPATATDWGAVEVPARYAGGLEPDSPVVGLVGGGRARAYPVEVLSHHEVVNDALGGPVLVTFCPLCASGMVARRTVGGRPTTFAVSGLLWSPPGIEAARSEAEGRVFGVSRRDPDAEVTRTGNLVLYDERTRSYWSQLLARAICGPKTGTALDVLPASTATWRDWRTARPGTDVLLPPPHSGTV